KRFEKGVSDWLAGRCPQRGCSVSRYSSGATSAHPVQLVQCVDGVPGSYSLIVDSRCVIPMVAWKQMRTRGERAKIEHSSRWDTWKWYVHLTRSWSVADYDMSKTGSERRG